MNLLMLLPAAIVALTVIAAITSAREIQNLKTELAQLDVRLADSRARLQQAKQHRATIAGTYDMLSNMKTFRTEQMRQLQEEIKKLEEELVEEREINLAVPPTAPPKDGI